MAVTHLLFEPTDFFESGRDSWLGGLIAVLTLCTLALASLMVPIAILASTGKDLGVAESFPTVRYVSGEARLVLDGRALGAAAIVAAAPVPVLAGFAVLFHLLSWPLSDQGSLPDTVRMTVWGAVPLSIANALTLVGTVAVLPTEFDELLYAHVTPTGRTIVQRSDPSVLLLGVNLLGLACVCWAAVVWTRGLAHVRGLSTRRAAVTVGLPVALVAGVDLGNILYGFV